MDPWHWCLLIVLSLQTIGRDSALQKSCRPCVRWHPAAAIWSQSQNAAAMGDEAGVTSVSFAHFLELPSTKRYVLMAQDTPLMEEVKSWENSCILPTPWISWIQINLKEKWKNWYSDELKYLYAYVCLYMLFASALETLKDTMFVSNLRGRTYYYYHFNRWGNLKHKAEVTSNFPKITPFARDGPGLEQICLTPNAMHDPKLYLFN